MRFNVVAVGGLVVSIAFMSVCIPSASAGLISPTKTLNLSSWISDIEIDPVRPLAYLSAADSNSVLIFSFATLDVTGSIFVGSSPGRMDLDPSLDRLYVALGGGPGVAVVNLTSQMLEATWPISAGTSDVAVGRPGRLYVTIADTGGSWTYPRIMDTTTGSEVAQITAVGTIYSNAILDISPDFRYLYIAERGLSPASLMKFDVQTDSASLVAEDQHGALGGNLQDMALSPDGARMYVACGAPYYIQVINTTDITEAGQLHTDAYPSTAAVNGDGSIVLGGKFNPYGFEFYSFNSSTFLKIDTFRTTNEVYDVTIDSVGQYILAFTADDYYGEFYLDIYADVYQGPPIGTILSPTPDSWLDTTSVSIQVRFEDPDGIEVSILSISLDHAGLTESWDPVTRIVSASSTGLAPGQHDLEARASDLLGYGPRILTWSFFVDTTPPSSSVDALLQYSMSPVPLTATASDDQGVAKVELYARSGTGPWGLVQTQWSGPWSFSVTLPEGPYEFYSVAEDFAGNREAAPASADASTFVDSSPPTLTILSPEQGGWTGSNVTVSWSAEDSGSGIDSIRIRLDAGSWTTLPPTALEYTFLNLAEGFHSVNLEAGDRAGWIESASTFFWTDSVAPTIALTSPLGSPRLESGPVIVSWIASDSTAGLDRCEISVNNQSAIDVGLQTTITFSTLGNGTYFFRVRAYDKAGNSADVTAIVTIAPRSQTQNQTHEPSVNVIVSTDLIWVYVLLAVLSLTFIIFIIVFILDRRRHQ